MVTLAIGTGFGLAFFLFSLIILIMIIIRKKYAKLLYNYFIGCFGVILFNILYYISSFSENGGFFFGVGLIISFSIALGLYCGFLSGCLVLYNRKKVYQYKEYANTVRMTMFKYYIPFVVFYILGLMTLPIFIFFDNVSYAPLLVGVILCVIAAALAISYVLDKVRWPNANTYFNDPKFNIRIFDKKLPLVILVALFISGTLLELNRGAWFVWGAHCFFLVIIYLIHKRYWRSVYK